jgi:hypothetical protein
MTPSAQTKAVPLQKSGISLETFEQTKIYKDYVTPAQVVSMEDALARVGNDHKKLLAVISDGLKAESQREARSSDQGWYELDEKGEKTPFTSALVEPEVVNPTVLTLAKTVYDYDDATTPEEKREAKRLAFEHIKSDPRIVAGLKKRALARATEAE